MFLNQILVLDKAAKVKKKKKIFFFLVFFLSYLNFLFLNFVFHLSCGYFL